MLTDMTRAILLLSVNFSYEYTPCPGKNTYILR